MLIIYAMFRYSLIVYFEQLAPQSKGATIPCLGLWIHSQTLHMTFRPRPAFGLSTSSKQRSVIPWLITLLFVALVVAPRFVHESEPIPFETGVNEELAAHPAMIGLGFAMLIGVLGSLVVLIVQLARRPDWQARLELSSQQQDCGAAGIGAFAGFAVLFILISGLVSELTDGRMGWMWFLAAATAIPIIVLVLVYGRRFTAELLGLPPLTSWLKEIGVGVKHYIAVIPLIIFIMLMSFIFLPLEGAHPIQEELLAAASWQTWLILASVAVIMAPVTEELVFRGMLYSHCRLWMDWWTAALLNGVIFAVIHPQGLVALPSLIFLGMVMAWQREARGNVIAPIAMHMCHNGLLIGIAFFQWYVQQAVE